MSLTSLLNKIAGITTNGLNTAVETRDILNPLALNYVPYTGGTQSLISDYPIHTDIPNSTISGATGTILITKDYLDYKIGSLSNDSEAKVINVSILDLSGYTGTQESKIVQYINSLNYVKEGVHAEIWVEYDDTVPALILTWEDINELPDEITDASDVSQWNALFELPSSGTPFTEVSVEANEVHLRGGSGITLADELFSNQVNGALDTQNGFLLEIVDEINSIIAIGVRTFSYTPGWDGTNSKLTNVVLPLVTTIGEYAFNQNLVLKTIGMPLVTNISDYAFYYCELIDGVNMPSLITVGDYAFYACVKIPSFNFPLLTTVGDYALGGDYSSSSMEYTEALLPEVLSVGDDAFRNSIYCTNFHLPKCTNLGSSATNNSVFTENGNDGLNITLTIPVALMTINGGGPDGDIGQDPALHSEFTYLGLEFSNNLGGPEFQTMRRNLWWINNPDFGNVGHPTENYYNMERGVELNIVTI